MKFAKYVFLIAGIYGLCVTFPLYFSEQQFEHDSPPAITHPEFFYSFITVTLVWQILFLFMSTDPVRYRKLMIPCMLEKTPPLVAFLILYPQGRFPQLWILFMTIDILLAALFLLAYLKTKKLETNG
jgi:hypothetical protein